VATKVLSNQRVTVIAGLASGVSDWSAVTLAELAALTNVSGAINWSSFDLNIQASSQTDDRVLTDGAGSQSRSPMTNFGGGLELVNPRPEDTSSIFRTAYNIFSTPRVELVVAVRYGKLNSVAPAAGDRWMIYRLMSDAVSFGENDVSKYYRVNLIARDDLLVEYIVPPATAVAPTVTALSATGSVDDLIFASAVYQGLNVTKEVTWISSDEGDLVEVHPGIFKAIATGTPTLVASYPGATNSTAVTITIS